jgi:hypothetical protein
MLIYLIYSTFKFTKSVFSKKKSPAPTLLYVYSITSQFFLFTVVSLIFCLFDQATYRLLRSRDKKLHISMQEMEQPP